MEKSTVHPENQEVELEAAAVEPSKKFRKESSDKSELDMHFLGACMPRECTW